MSWIAGGLLMVGLMAAAAAWWLFGGPGAIEARGVKDLLAATQEINPVEATAELCSDPVCVEGWKTDYGNFLRFESEGQAEHWAVILGDQGRRWKHIVLDMSDVELTFEQRRKAIDTLFSAHDWS